MLRFMKPQHPAVFLMREAFIVLEFEIIRHPLMIFGKSSTYFRTLSPSETRFFRKKNAENALERVARGVTFAYRPCYCVYG